VKHGVELSPAWIRSALAVEVTERAVVGLAAFELMLAERAVPLGMVGESDASRLRERHVLDCLRAVAAVEEPDSLAYDMGSGAGLPGLVVALARPSLRVVLIESRSARCAFLELAIERLDLPNASVHAGRVEDLAGPADLCFARALATLRRSWSLAAPRLRPGGRLVYFAGAGASTSGLPADAQHVRVLETPVLESAGSLIIMTR
jgi:16S rRNA (guanine527-N7)-methyltransferase